jgi:nucleoside-diphosphate-sugar epimerase
LLKRMDDCRPAILIQEDAAAWRGPRGYVENVAAGIALAVTSSRAASRIYNLGEPEAFSEREWTERVGRAAGWKGRVIPLSKARTPEHLRVPYRSEQHWVVSTQKIRDELRFVEPVSLDVALARTVEWERTNPPPQIDPGQFNYSAEDAVLAVLGSDASQ